MVAGERSRQVKRRQRKRASERAGRSRRVREGKNTQNTTDETYKERADRGVIHERDEGGVTV